MQRLDMNHAILHLWIAYPDDLLGEEAAQACLRLLSEDERARWQAFKFDRTAVNIWPRTLWYGTHFSASCHSSRILVLSVKRLRQTSD